MLTSFKKKKRQSIKKNSVDSVAIVKEDGLFRAYYLNGEAYDISIKELDDYFVIHSKMIETTILMQVSKDRTSIKLFGILDKALIYPNRKKRKKVEELILRTFWQKN